MATLSDGAMLMWFILTGLSIIFVAIDIRTTPEHPIVKWAFVILAVFGGPLAAFFYVLGCREPLKGTHEAYIAAPWRQVLGSTMHCAAGDGIGIIVGAAISASWHFPPWADLVSEYILGFGFGWSFFQAFAMRDMAGGSYVRSLKQTFLPEMLSMNLLMAGMLVAADLLMPQIPGSGDPAKPGFWFAMSMALIMGFLFAYPMNWWLVSRGLKHGMFTVRHGEQLAHEEHGWQSHKSMRPSGRAIAGVTTFSIVVLALGIIASHLLGGTMH